MHTHTHRYSCAHTCTHNRGAEHAVKQVKSTCVLGLNTALHILSWFNQKLLAFLQHYNIPSIYIFDESPEKGNINSYTLQIIASLKMAFARPNLTRKGNHRVSSRVGSRGLNSTQPTGTRAERLVLPSFMLRELALIPPPQGPSITRRCRRYRILPEGPVT